MKEQMHIREEVELDPVYWNLPDFVDTEVGFLKEVYRCRMHGSCPLTFMYCGKMCNTLTMFSDRVADIAANWSSGINIDQKSAIRGCIFEGIERYCSAIIPKERLLWGTERELIKKGYECMTRTMFDYFADEQYLRRRFRHQKWTATSNFRWDCSKSLNDGREFFIPAQFIYVPYYFMQNETKLIDTISTGLACHRTLEKAIYAGLCEVVERDSFTIFWYNMLKSPQVVVESLSGRNSQIDILLGRINDIPGCELTIKDITTDSMIPTLLCILQNKKNKKAVATAFAAATDLDPITALQKALNEVLGTYTLAYILRYERDEYCNISINPARWNQTYTLNDHVALYAFHEIYDYICWLDDGPLITISDILEKYKNPSTRQANNTKYFLDECNKRLKLCNLEAFYTDITTEDIEASGFKVVRVCIPGCVPLQSVHVSRPIGCKRLYTVPPKIGLTRPTKMNVVPHPYP